MPQRREVDTSIRQLCDAPWAAPSVCCAVPKPLASAVMTDETAHKNAPHRPTRLTPKRSSTTPAGICRSAYTHENALKRTPISPGVSWNASLSCGAATDIVTRSI